MLLVLALMGAEAVAVPSACPIGRPGAPITIQIERVKDGDTFRSTCRDRFGYPEDYRLLDLDTPEKGAQAKCPEEAAHAKKASAFVTSMAVKSQMQVTAVLATHKEKYGRYLASASFTIGGERIDWRDALIESGFALAYDGGKKADWCAILKGGQ